MKKILLFSILSLSIAFSQPDLCSMEPVQPFYKEKDIMDLLTVNPTKKNSVPSFVIDYNSSDDSEKFRNNKLRKELKGLIKNNNPESLKRINNILEQIFKKWKNAPFRKQMFKSYINYVFCSNLYRFMCHKSLMLMDILTIAVKFNSIKTVELIFEHHYEFLESLEKIKGPKTTRQKRHYKSSFQVFNIVELFCLSITEGHLEMVKYLKEKYKILRPENKVECFLFTVLKQIANGDIKCKRNEKEVVEILYHGVEKIIDFVDETIK